MLLLELLNYFVIVDSIITSLIIVIIVIKTAHLHNLVYSYVIEVADFESQLGLFSSTLVLEIFALNHLLEIAF